MWRAVLIEIATPITLLAMTGFKILCFTLTLILSRRGRGNKSKSQKLKTKMADKNSKIDHGDVLDYND